MPRTSAHGEVTGQTGLAGCHSDINSLTTVYHSYLEVTVKIH